MNNKKTADVFNTSNGYITLSRNFVEQVFNHINEYNKEILYGKLLTNANFRDSCTEKGVMLQRGEIEMRIDRLQEITRWKKTKLYDTIKQLEKEDLLVKLTDKGHGCYMLPMYEEHCGSHVRKEERVHTPGPEENRTESSFMDFFSFYHFLLATPRLEQEKARREWQKLSMDEREEAIRNVERYKNAVQKREHLKLACNYLKDKSFKDLK